MITSLTAEQEAQIKLYYEQYLKIGLSIQTEDLNAEEFKKDLTSYYALYGYKAPDIQIYDSPHQCQHAVNKINNEKNTYISTWFLGSLDSYWISFYSYLIEVLKLDIDKELKDKFLSYRKWSQQVGFSYLYDTAAFVSLKPIKINLDSQGRLHSDIGKAIEYRDGWGVSAIHGVRVPHWIAAEKDKITVKHIDEEKNAEIRRVMLDFYSIERYIKDSDVKVIDEDTDQYDRPRRLLLKEMEGDESILRVEVTNSSPEFNGDYKKYYLPIDPECRPILIDPLEDKYQKELETMTREDMIRKNYLGESQSLTCHNAVASTFGKYGSQYGLKGQIRQGDVFIEFKDGSNNVNFRES